MCGEIVGSKRIIKLNVEEEEKNVHSHVIRYIKWIAMEIQVLGEI